MGMFLLGVLLGIVIGLVGAVGVAKLRELISK